MKFGLAIPGLMLFRPTMHPWEPDAPHDTAITVARKADDLGFDWVSVTEHIIIPGEAVRGYGARYTDSLASLAVLAGATRRVRVLNYVLAVPLRHPVLLAKSVATVDYLSGGRMILGAGLGALPREFKILGVPYEERGPLADEYIEAMKELWTSENPEFSGRTVQFENVVFDPRPIQKPHPPIWIGGNSRRAIRRAAQHGDGWMPWLVTPQQLPDYLSHLREQPAFAERDRPFDIIMPLMQYAVDEKTHQPTGETIIPDTTDDAIDAVGLLKEAGATGIVVHLPRTASLDEYLERMDWFAGDVMSKFQG